MTLEYDFRKDIDPIYGVIRKFNKRGDFESSLPLISSVAEIYKNYSKKGFENDDFHLALIYDHLRFATFNSISRLENDVRLNSNDENKVNGFLSVKPSLFENEIVASIYKFPLHKDRGFTFIGRTQDRFDSPENIETKLGRIFPNNGNEVKDLIVDWNRYILAQRKEFCTKTKNDFDINESEQSILKKYSDNKGLINPISNKY